MYIARKNHKPQSYMEKYRGKYRVPSARAQWWDYGADAAYFITICTKNRTHFFGEITDKAMHLSPVGAIADVFWHEIKNHAENVELGEFVVMPNHIHGILILDKSGGDAAGGGVVETGYALSLPGESPGKKRFRNPGKNTVSSIIGGYKSAVTKHANRLGFDFGWQERFHDHIIRDEKEYQRIARYILANVENWKDDRFYQ